MERLHAELPPRAYLPIMVITADITPEARLRALILGAKDFLHKPIDAVETMLRIRILLETRFLFLALEREVQHLRLISGIGGGSSQAG
jgi:DNA-binding response OmpR family regulator